MPDKQGLSKTMRIDLIPDVPSEPSVGKKKRIVITALRRAPQGAGQPGDGVGESHYQELLRGIYDAVLICDLQGRIVDVNPRAEEFLLYHRHELVVMTVFEVISGADESLLQTLCENLENERFTLIQAYCVRQDGTFFPAEIAVNKLRLGRTYLCFFIRDITLRRQAEEMLRTEHNAIHNSGNGIAVTDSKCRLEYVNPAFARTWGFDEAEELLGRDVRELLGDRETSEGLIEAVMSGRQARTGEMKGIRKDGTAFDLQVSAAANLNSDGETIGTVLSFVDISDRKRAEAAIREAERQRVMLESLGAACHHLGQPATILLANLGLMGKMVGDAGDEKMKELLGTSLTACRTLGEILHKLNTVNEYKTTEYLKKAEGSDEDEHRIIEI